jgi:hypothetical protein
MRNDSIETLLLRHYGSAAPAPVDLEQQLSAMVHRETITEHTKQQEVRGWNERRVSRRKVLQLATFTSAGIGMLAVGVNTLQGQPRKPAYAF